MTDAADVPPGAVVVDRDADEQNPAVVVNTPPVRADEWNIGGCTVAEYTGNEQYDDGAAIVLVVFRGELAEWRPEYAGEDPIPAATVAGSPAHGYTFPRPRLEVVGHLDDEEAADADDSSGTDPALVTLADALRERRVSSVQVSGETVEVEKLGVTYHVAPDGTVREDDRVADQLEDIARDVLAGEEVPA